MHIHQTTTSIQVSAQATSMMEELLGLPIATAAARGLAGIAQLRHHLLDKKIAGFLEELEHFHPRQVEEFVGKKMKDPGNYELVSEITLHTIEVADSRLIAKMVGRAYCNYLSGKLHQAVYEDHISIIRSLNLHLLRQLRQIYHVGATPAPNLHTGYLFSTLGLMITADPGMFRSNSSGSNYLRSDFGQVFYDSYVRDLDIPPILQV